VPWCRRRVSLVLPEGADELATGPQVLAQAGTNGAADACISGTGAGEEVPSGVSLSPDWVLAGQALDQVRPAAGDAPGAAAARGLTLACRNGITCTSKNGGELVRITSKGQVTIPQAIRERVGLLPNTEVEFIVDGDLVMLVKAAEARRPTRGELGVGHLRRHGVHMTLSTDEIMSLTRGEE